MPRSAAEFRTMFLFGAPNETPHSWNLGFDDFTAALLRRNPQAFTRLTRDPLLGDNLSFTFDTADGTREGMVSVDPDGAALNDCTAGEALEFALWLRREIVPPDAEIHFNLREAAAIDLPNLPLPTGDPTATENALLDYVSDMLAARARGEL
ncbi:hypothetical protein ABZ746_36615 [Streptomyces sp. NPDC020096]